MRILRSTTCLAFLAASMCAAASVPLQPLAQQVRRLEDALDYLGQPLSAKTAEAIDQAIALPDEAAAVEKIQQALDPLALALVDINAEARVKVERGRAEAVLVQGGSRFL